jgi:cobalamin-dependent methionine synthase I
LSLFAVTLGDAVSNQIDELFKTNEFALGSMLDSAASVAAENVADVVQDRVFDMFMEEKKNHGKTGIMRFSPGYCGWHMSGQRKLFEFLQPEDIGITLLDSYLMKPLKSISGVMVVGGKNIFVFEDSYAFCSQCSSHSCRDRIRTLLGGSKANLRKGTI